MPLLGLQRMNEYEVKMLTDDGDMLIEYVLSPDVERAAWQALELSSHRECTLKDVRMIDEW